MSNVLEDIIMVNQINDSAGLKALDLNSRVKVKEQDKKNPVAENNAAKESVNLSDISKQLESVKASFKEVPEVDEQRVLRFKAEIAAGTYQINSAKIAQNMLHNAELA